MPDSVIGTRRGQQMLGWPPLPELSGTNMKKSPGGSWQITFIISATRPSIALKHDKACPGSDSRQATLSLGRRHTSAVIRPVRRAAGLRRPLHLFPRMQITPQTQTRTRSQAQASQ